MGLIRGLLLSAMASSLLISCGIETDTFQDASQFGIAKEKAPEVWQNPIHSQFTIEGLSPDSGDLFVPTSSNSHEVETVLGTFTVPRSLKAEILQRAARYFQSNPEGVTNPHYIGMIDYTIHSKYRRFFILSLRYNSVTYHHTAHGIGSADGRGHAVRFSNTPNSRKTSLGFMHSGRTYFGAHGKSLKLHGLSSTNDNNFRRFIVIHKARYVTDRYIARNGKAGRSHGCPALDPAVRDSILNRLTNWGSDQALIYAYGGQESEI